MNIDNLITIKIMQIEVVSVYTILSITKIMTGC